MTNFNEMSTKELVAAYNEMAKALDDALVMRFSDRKTGIRRCEKMAEKYAAAFPKVEEKVEEEVEERVNFDKCPNCGAHEDQTAAGIEGAAAEDRNLCHNCGTEYWRVSGKIYNAPVHSATRSAAIAASWANPETAAKRAQRHAVRVSGPQGGEFRSVRAAFAALNLPMSRHIKFRMELKAAGKLEAFGYKWEIIEA